MQTEQSHTHASSAARAQSVLRLISLFGIILALIAVPSLAWIAHHRMVEQNSQMGIDGGAVVANRFQAYQQNDEGETVEVTGEALCLPVFDSVFLGQNENKTIVFRAPVFGSAIAEGTPFTINLNLRDMSEETGDGDNNNYFNGTKPGAESTAIADYLSNVVTIKCAIITGGNMQSDTVSASDVYGTAHEYFKTVSEQKTFVVNDENNVYVRKDASISFDIEGYESTSGILYVYLEMGYDSVLVNELVESRGLTVYAGEAPAQSGNAAQNIIQLESDLEEFVFAVKEQ